MGLGTFHSFVGTVVARTARAILFHGTHWHCPCWLPVSQITETKIDEEEVLVTASDWICKQKGVSEFQEVECPVEETDG